MKTVVIHITKAVERDDLVKQIVDLTGATIFEAILHEKGGIGCTMSHKEIYKQSYPEDLLIFEDDCQINDPSFVKFIEESKDKYDIIYIGVNKIFYKNTINSFFQKNKINSYGTHAMWISPKAINLYLNYNPKSMEIDNIWSEIENKYNLKVWRPTNIYKYVEQRVGLKSYITGKLRT
uniref:Glycosyl transferase family 25 domain-containing protein n=1 Tax=viral metagenome TaxID=1070528 RepID=A0A6C0EQ38_9ZZZZ